MRIRKKRLKRPNASRKGSAQIKGKGQKLPHKPTPIPLGNSAQMASLEKTLNTLLTIIRTKTAKQQETKQRGRPSTMKPEEITGRARHYNLILTQSKDLIKWDRLPSARTDGDLEVVFANIPYYRDSYFRPIFSLMLQAIREPTFPKADAEAMIQFLAESLAGNGVISLRRSRDICLRERTRPSEPKIVRRENWIVCECGYRGFSFCDECPDCLIRNPSKMKSVALSVSLRRTRVEGVQWA